MKRSISVNGSAHTILTPDTAQLGCGVQVRATNAHEALSRANSAMTAVIDALGQARVSPVEAAGVSVGRVIRIEEANAHPPRFAMRAMAELASATPIEPGTHDLRVDVKVTYELVHASPEGSPN